MAAKVRMPVRMRIGDGEEHEVGTVTMRSAELSKRDLADVLRKAADEMCPKRRWYAGRTRIHGWLRWLPLFISPTFADHRHPFRTASGVLVNAGPWGVYLFRDRG